MVSVFPTSSLYKQETQGTEHEALHMQLNHSSVFFSSQLKIQIVPSGENSERLLSLLLSQETEFISAQLKRKIIVIGLIQCWIG